MKTVKNDPNITEKEDVGARQKIIAAATTLFAEHGLHGVSTRDIAKKSGMNLSLISYYFGGKEGLYKTVMEEFADHVYKEISTFIDKEEQQEVQPTNIKKSISGILDIMLSLKETHPEMAQIMTREKLSGGPGCSMAESSFMRIGEKLKTIIVNGQKAGAIRKEINADFFFFCLLESLMAYFNATNFNAELSEVCYSLTTQTKELKEQMLLIFLEGILK